MKNQLAQSFVQRGDGNAAAEFFLQLLFGDRTIAVNQLKGVTSQGRIRRTRPGFRSELGIALAHQRIEIRKHRGRDEKRVIFLNQIRLVGSAFAQQSRHEFRGSEGPGIGVGMLPGRQAIV